ncbi:hypothetical protein [Biostraticola tofi]|uniref:Uncharacterized protein n=1 Tax=Biostraticola tofi TaxID=466109 RepID=A0A4R3Z3M6_9GAMM|nr:hypothetical protein [Biostraticola tofi]TCW00434.1 hypothetical protein EDC52_101784 [Biostraticola tofi]
MQEELAGASCMGRPFDAIKFIQHHPLNRLTSQSFKHKSLLAKLVEFLKQAGRP